MVYQAEKQACRAFPDPKGDASASGAEAIEKILRGHQSGAMVGGLWQSSTPRTPPEVDGLVLELDAAYSTSSIRSPDQADQSQELTYVDIDTFLASFFFIAPLWLFPPLNHQFLLLESGLVLKSNCLSVLFSQPRAVDAGTPC